MTSVTGKTVGNRIYIHADEAYALPADSLTLTKSAERITPEDAEYNVLRIDSSRSEVSFLHYPHFFDEPFPQLAKSWLVRVNEGSVTHRTYESSLNPPILHRKELLISQAHPRHDEFQSLTESAESLGLFEDTSRIGYKVQWEHLIRERGYMVSGHQIVPIGNDESNDIDTYFETDNEIYRHRTAMVRYDLSAPMKSLARHGFLDGEYEIFDYGCGRGDDVRGLRENGLVANGWDPHFAPGNPIVKADIVNLGFVTNVIEDFDERIEAVARAFSLAKTLLVVSVMIANENSQNGRIFNDGIVTQRGTFQKYYTQGEFTAFLQEVLDVTPVPMGPGIAFVFRDKDAEQRFLFSRYKRKPNRLLTNASRLIAKSQRQQERTQALYNAHKDELDTLWLTALSLGRKPDIHETKDSGRLIQSFGTFNKAWRFLLTIKDPKELQNAQNLRIDDLIVYLALREFEAKKAYKHLEPGIKRDIKTFFGTITAAKTAARETLFTIADIEAVHNACKYASQHELGYYQDNEFLQLHTSLVELLPPVLRIYCGCATALYGDYKEADLVKIHIASGKLTLMLFDDFEGKPLPSMTERIKLKLRDQDIEYYSYDDIDYVRPYLYQKSRYINEEFQNFPLQEEFDEALARLSFVDPAGYGPSASTLNLLLKSHRWQISEFRLIRSKDIPNLDDPCGQYLTFRDFIECGETQKKTGLPNIPKESDTYTALHDLATNVLDPVIDYFGMIKLTYGFCSPELERKIPKGIAPKLDQHAAHEKRRTGNYICQRLGAAVDFVIEYENMLEVVHWINENTSFDRIYFYGPDLPIHVSYSNTNGQSIYQIKTYNDGRKIPSKLAI